MTWLADNGFPLNRVDVVLVGDGSGSGWDVGCGWGCFLIAPNDKIQQTFCGGFNLGTISHGELMPYIHALIWYDYHHGKRIRHNEQRTIRVHIFTDSKHIEIVGNQLCRGEKRKSDIDANKELWEVVHFIHRRGYELIFHWHPRNTFEENIAADKLSKSAREAIRNVQLDV